MIRTRFVCSLDNTEREIWPTSLDFRPVVGDYIESGCVWNKERTSLSLVVATVAIKPDINYPFRDIVGWYLEIELRPPSNFKSMAHFEAWYGHLRGQSSREHYLAQIERLRAEGAA